ncbi:MAG: hypothetical protein K0R54_748 [Clostridiaceae bacterium]|jgi:hypothetical protein|nr:hypothetical protein [Clostridiaceae bacterium]
MSKCKLVLDINEEEVIADSLEDENWQTGDRLVHEDTVFLILDFIIINNVKIYRVKIK